MDLNGKKTDLVISLYYYHNSDSTSPELKLYNFNILLFEIAFVKLHCLSILKASLAVAFFNKNDKHVHFYTPVINC